MVLKTRADLKNIIDLSLPGAELGVAEGLFSRDILSWGITKLYLVDAWETLPGTGDGANPQAWHNENYANVIDLMRPFGDRAVILRGLTSEMCHAVEDSLGFLYLDANHSFEAVMEDLNNWTPKVVCGGIVGGHDWGDTAYGVQQAVTNFCNMRGYDINVIPENGQDASFYFIKTC